MLCIIEDSGCIHVHVIVNFFQCTVIYIKLSISFLCLGSRHSSQSSSVSAKPYGLASQSLPRSTSSTPRGSSSTTIPRTSSASGRQSSKL